MGVFLKITSKPLTSELMGLVCGAGGIIQPDRLVRCRDAAHRQMIKDLVEDYVHGPSGHPVLPDRYMAREADGVELPTLKENELWLVGTAMTRIL